MGTGRRFDRALDGLEVEGLDEVALEAGFARAQACARLGLPARDIDAEAMRLLDEYERGLKDYTYLTF